MQALAASGLRALRYAKEVEQVGSVVACDNDKGSFLLGKPHLIHALNLKQWSVCFGFIQCQGLMCGKVTWTEIVHMLMRVM